MLNFIERLPCGKPCIVILFTLPFIHIWQACETSNPATLRRGYLSYRKATQTHKNPSFKGQLDSKTITLGKSNIRILNSRCVAVTRQTNQIRECEGEVYVSFFSRNYTAQRSLRDEWQTALTGWLVFSFMRKLVVRSKWVVTSENKQMPLARFIH